MEVASAASGESTYRNGHAIANFSHRLPNFLTIALVIRFASLNEKSCFDSYLALPF